MSFDSTTSEAHIERLLTALAGVVSAHIVRDETGRLVEVHILANHELHPKQIVRNVESALSAGLGIHIDRRIISVAQLRPDAAAEAAAGEFPETEPARAGFGRCILLGYETASVQPFDASCSVTISAGGHQYTGTATGTATPAGRAETAARALFDALVAAVQPTDSLGIEGVSIVETNGRSFVLVSAHFVASRSVVRLTGISLLGRSAEEAAILAALQATNRWVAAAQA